MLTALQEPELFGTSELLCARTTVFLVRLIRPTQFYQLSLISSQLCGHPVSSAQRSSKGNWMGVAPVQGDSSRNGEGTGKQTGSCLEEGGHEEASVKLFQGRETTEPESQQGAEGKK